MLLRGLLALAVVLAAFFWYQSRQPSVATGATAPDFSVTLADGSAAKLSDLRGKIVLLHFWGSWCGPCRAENPHLKALYERYNASGFEIFSIGIEDRSEAWQRAIEKDGLTWKWHSSDFQSFKGPIAKLYNIHQIPTTFLINKQGRVMAINLSPEQMEKMLKEQL